jgi:Spy/CpxP family protein refolding chaperone
MILNALMRPGWLLGGVAALGLGAAGLAWAHGVPGHGGHGGHCGLHGKAGKLHVQMVTDQVLRVAEATPEQRSKVEALLEKGFADHARYREQHEELRAEALEIFTADTIDRGRLEALRAKHMQFAEQGSQHLTQVLGDVAEVLTPAQRQKLAAHVREMLE